jgi:chromosome partitioning protein
MAGKVVLVCKLKGGAGATTTVRELAAAALGDGKSVAVIDLDAQGGATRWWNRRTKATGSEDSPALLRVTAEQLPAMADKLRARYDLVLIDSPPTVHEQIRLVAGGADLALVPSRPNVDDLDAVGPITRLLHGVVDLGYVLTQVPGKRSLDGAEAFERLASRAAVLGRTTFRSAYSRPPSSGSTGFETDVQARAEIAALYERVKDRLGWLDDENTLSGDDVTT